VRDYVKNLGIRNLILAWVVEDQNLAWIMIAKGIQLSVSHVRTSSFTVTESVKELFFFGAVLRGNTMGI
jgi:hypothetical protein